MEPQTTTPSAWQLLFVATCANILRPHILKPMTEEELQAGYDLAAAITNQAVKPRASHVQ